MCPPIQIERTGPDDPRLRSLIEELDAYLRSIDGDELHEQLRSYNRLEPGTRAIVAVMDDAPVGCGALRSRDPHTAEIKRMYVRPSARGMKIGTLILQGLEVWAADLGHTQTILETMPALASAIRLYETAGYRRIPCYPPYDEIAHSVCYERDLALHAVSTSDS